MHLSKHVANALRSLSSGVALPSNERAVVDAAITALDKDAVKEAKKAPKPVADPA